MVATRVLISLCVAGLTVAAPQLDLPGVQRTVTTSTSLAAGGVDEETLVTSVVTALEPSIAAAVANALRSLQTTSVTTLTSDNSAAQVSGGAVSTGFTSTSSAGGQAAFSTSGKSSSSASASAAAEKAAFEKEFAASRESAEPTTRPEYNFEFKVADSDEQTYITQQESRDGDELTGSYSYVDPTGALITVNYQAGPDGFSQTTDKQEGFVQIVAKPPRIAAAAAASASSSGSKTSSSTSSSGSAGGAFTSQQSSTTSSAASTLDQSALIAQILAALQPQISASVNAALTASQSRATQSVIAVPAAVVPAPLAVRPAPQAARPVAATQASRTAAASGGNLASLFGDGYAVRIATPEFKIEY